MSKDSAPEIKYTKIFINNEWVNSGKCRFHLPRCPHSHHSITGFAVSLQQPHQRIDGLDSLSILALGAKILQSTVAESALVCILLAWNRCMPTNLVGGTIN